MQEIGEFHSRDGFYFKRQEDGAVRIRVAEGGRAADSVLREVTLPGDEWASVMASVSRQRETSATWERARAFHNGDIPPWLAQSAPSSQLGSVPVHVGGRVVSASND